MPFSVASDLGLHCLLISHKNEGRPKIWLRICLVCVLAVNDDFHGLCNKMCQCQFNRLFCLEVFIDPVNVGAQSCVDRNISFRTTRFPPRGDTHLHPISIFVVAPCASTGVTL